jgi:hypothetical protein
MLTVENPEVNLNENPEVNLNENAFQSYQTKEKRNEHTKKFILEQLKKTKKTVWELNELQTGSYALNKSINGIQKTILPTFPSKERKAIHFQYVYGDLFIRICEIREYIHHISQPRTHKISAETLDSLDLDKDSYKEAKFYLDEIIAMKDTVDDYYKQMIPIHNDGMKHEEYRNPSPMKKEAFFKKNPLFVSKHGNLTYKGIDYEVYFERYMKFLKLVEPGKKPTEFNPKERASIYMTRPVPRSRPAVKHNATKYNATNHNATNHNATKHNAMNKSKPKNNATKSKMPKLVPRRGIRVPVRHVDSFHLKPISEPIPEPIPEPQTPRKALRPIGIRSTRPRQTQRVLSKALLTEPPVSPKSTPKNTTRKYNFTRRLGRAL